MTSKSAFLIGLSAVVLAGCTPAIPTTDVSAPAATGAEAAKPAGLTADQTLVWNSMTPQARAQAVDFIANGGTFAQFIAV